MLLASVAALPRLGAVTVNCQTLTPLAGAVNLFILTRTPSKPPGFIYIPAGDSGLFAATAEFLRITQDPSTESVARACRARAYAREFLTHCFYQGVSPWYSVLNSH